MAWRAYNPNPGGLRVGDCTVRALCKALGRDWEQIHAELYLDSFCAYNMPSANLVWGACLRRHGFRRRTIPDECPASYTVADFAADHPRGVFVLALDGHVVCVEDGDWFDTWDSGGEVPIYYFAKEA